MYPHAHSLGLASLVWCLKCFFTYCNSISSSLCSSLSFLLAYTVKNIVVAAAAQNPKTVKIICGAERLCCSCEASASVRIRIPLQWKRPHKFLCFKQFPYTRGERKKWLGYSEKILSYKKHSQIVLSIIAHNQIEKAILNYKHTC